MKAKGLRLALAKPISQADFAEMVGVSEARISTLFAEPDFERGDTAGEWLIAYCVRLREIAAGRLSGGQHSLMQERAALTRSQREEQDRKNAIARGDFAPIGLLADVLANASAAIVSQLNQFDADLAKVWPDMPDAALTKLRERVASARNAWIKDTAALVDRQLQELDAADEEGGELAEADA